MQQSSLPRPGWTRADAAMTCVLIVAGLTLALPACSKVATTSDQTNSENNLKNIGQGAHQMFEMRAGPVRAAAARATSQNNLKQMGIGILSIASSYNGLEPPAVGEFPKGGFNSTIFFHLLPFVEQDPIYKLVTANGPPGNMSALTPKTHVKMYCAPADQSNPGDSALCSYASNQSIFGGVAGGSARFPAMFNAKGTTYCILFFEHYANPAPEGGTAISNYWYSPTTALYAHPPGPINTPWTTIKDPQFDVPPTQPKPAPDNATAHAFSTNSLNVLMADGSARVFTNKATARVNFNSPGGPPIEASIWQWACNVHGALGNTNVPEGW